MNDWAYKILDIDKNASIRVIKSKYRSLCKIYHPDKYNNLNDQFIKIKKAYDALNNQDEKPLDIFPLDIIDIISCIECTLEDKYLDRILVMDVERTTKCSIEIYMNLSLNIMVLKGEGEQNGTKHGDIIIYTDMISNESYSISKYDLIKKYFISLYEYLYGGKIEFKHLDGLNIFLEHKGFINRKNKIEIKNKGLLMDSKNRGNLIVEVFILGIDAEEFKQKILLI